jgi:ABC-type multidrug transport system fused ATPase/permease subunit
VRHYLWQARVYYRQVAGLLLVGSLFGMVMNVSVALPPVLLGAAIDATLACGAGASGPQAVLWAALAYAGGATLHAIARVGKRWYLRAAVRRTVFAMRNDALRGLLAAPLEWLRRQSVGDLMARIIGDTELFGTGFNESTTEIWDTWLFSLTLLVTMLLYDARLTLLAMLPVPAAFYLAYRSREWVRQRTQGVRLANADLTAALQERLVGLRLLRLLGQSDQAVQRIDALSERLARAGLAETRLQAALQPVYALGVTAGVVLIVWLGGERVVQGDLSTGALVGFMLVYLRFVGRGFRLPLFFNRIQSAGVAWDRLQPFLPAPLPLEDEPPWASWRPTHVMGLYAQPDPPPPGESRPLAVRLERVTMRYPGAAPAALEEVSLDIPAGALVGVTGPIGSGKSALLRAIQGLYAPQAGQVLVDGEPVRSRSEAWRATHLRYLPQDANLFSGSIGENIGLDTDSITDEAAWLRIAALEDDLARFPRGLDTPVGEGGVQVSGGQRQRIALARALALPGGQTPSVLLLDDPFAAIDVETEGQIVAALRAALGQRTTVILCSHRLASFPTLERIFVLDRGRLVAQGSHAELLGQEGLYARIYRAQHLILGREAQA